MKRNVTRAVAPVLLAAVCALPAYAETYDVMNLGLGGPSTSVYIAGVNASGQVAGAARTANGEYHAFFASPSTGVIDIGTLGDGYSQAIAINASGMVVGNATIPNDVATWRPFVWTKDGGIVTIGSLGGRPSVAYAVNDAGTVIGASDTAEGYLHAFAWEPGGVMHDLGGAANALQNFAVAINASGYAAGYSTDANGRADALLFNPGGGANDLGRPGLADTAQAIAISDGGHVLVASSWVDEWGTVQKSQVWVYSDASSFANVGSLGGSGVTARAINKQGRVIGQSLLAGDNPAATHAYTWTLATGITDLTLGGASRAFAINESGQVVGDSVTAGGTNHGYSWSASGGMVDLGTLGGSASSAVAVNKTGQATGQAALANDTAFHGFVFDNGTMKDLNDLTPGKPAGLEILSGLLLSDSKAVVAATNAGFALLTPTSLLPAPPSVAPIVASDPVAVGAPLAVSAQFTDAATDTHTASWTFGDGSPSQAGAVSEANGAGTVSGSHAYAAAGVYPVVVTVIDGGGLRSSVSRDVVVYDPSAGFVTGSGLIQSPSGAYRPDPLAVGPATFSFVSKYQKGAKAPTGTTSFRFQTVGLDFESDAYEWLVVAGARAQFKGSGSVNGTSGYRFLLTAVDGEVAGGSNVDRFRIKVTYYDANTKQDVVVYDNQLDAGSEGTLSEGTALRGGNIVIHAAKG